MRLLRALVLIALFAVGAYYVYSYLSHRSGPVSADTITVYYTKPDGETVVPWRVSLGPARDRRSIAFYAATQALAGPPAGVEAIRFPPGTIARSVDVDASRRTAIVDLDGAAASVAQGGSFAESGEFKSLVWTLTALPDIDAVEVEVGGARVATLPGGHFEIDQPLTRASW